MKRPLSVLFVDDQDRDVELLALELRRGGYDVRRERVDTAESFAAALDRGKWDVVLCDWRMPRFSAPAALAMVREKDIELPFIVVSGIIGEETAVEALRAGAHDFMGKDRLARLVPAIDRELREAAVREERKQLRQQQLQAQKMEAIGQFAGGIAHDFNNVLTVIAGYVELTLDEGADPSRRRHHLLQVREASARAAALVRQILLFSRRQIIDPRVFALNAVMADMESLLARLMPANIEFVVTLAPDLGRIRADPGQIEQVLMNLVVNARDAMPEGGRLDVATRNAAPGDASGEPPGGPAAGSRVVLSVSDTGTGMDAATRGRIFEPFFTTKAPGRGTGLGLATVLGIVQQSGGAVEVRSEPGKGTTFEVILPRVEEAEDAVARPAAPRGVVGGGETILVVEDSEPIRELAVLVLGGRGYRVLAAGSPSEALALAAGEPRAIDLLVTDVILPGMSGTELARRLAGLRPGLRVLVVSGYAAEDPERSRILVDGLRFLPKPFTPSQLLVRVREVLDRMEGTGPPGDRMVLEGPLKGA